MLLEQKRDMKAEAAHPNRILTFFLGNRVPSLRALMELWMNNVRKAKNATPPANLKITTNA